MSAREDAMQKRTLSRLFAPVVLLALALLSVSCEGGAGLGLGVSYPGRIYSPVGGGSWGGGPAWP